MSDKLKKMLINVDDWEDRIAILEDGEVQEIYIERKKQRSIVGDVYLGRVQSVIRGIEAAFVDIGLEKNSFLYLNEKLFSENDVDSPNFDFNSFPKPGQKILVQAVKDSRGSKGAKVTMQIALPGRFLVLLPTVDFVGVSRKIEDETICGKLHEIGEKIKPKNMGLIFRTLSKDAEMEDFEKDLEYLSSLWNEISLKINQSKAPTLLYKEFGRVLKSVRDIFSSDFNALCVDEEKIYQEIIFFLDKTSPELKERVYLKKDKSLFDKYEINREIENILKRKIWLRSGGYITIDSTEALTAIDVNTGKYIGRNSLEETIFNTNIEAAKEIVHQIRLRDIGGIIVIDFIGMEKPDHKEMVFEIFNNALLSDRSKTRTIGISSLGLVEMTRQNVGEGLFDFFLEPCSECKGTGYVLSKEIIDIEIKRKIIEYCRKSTEEALLFGLHSAVLSGFQDYRKSGLDQLESKVDKKVFLIANDSCSFNDCVFIKDGTVEEIKNLQTRIFKENAS